MTLRSANMDRVNGWADILQGLGDPDAGIPPKLFTHQRCKRLVETRRCCNTIRTDRKMC
jgi:hypothetical protein